MYRSEHSIYVLLRPSEEERAEVPNARLKEAGLVVFSAASKHVFLYLSMSPFALATSCVFLTHVLWTSYVCFPIATRRHTLYCQYLTPLRVRSSRSA